MNKIEALGNDLLQAQAALGLDTANQLHVGLSEDKIKLNPLFLKLPADSEMHDLFRWRNGSDNSIPIGRLWLTPRYYFMSAEDSAMSNKYCSSNLEGWSSNWFPIFENGSANMWFVDVEKHFNGKLPVFDSDSESTPEVGQIYDSIQNMFETFLECYKQNVYHIPPGEKRFQTDFRREAEIAKKLNPNSDFWLRKDLF
jgi:hypothetical protein